MKAAIRGHERTGGWVQICSGVSVSYSEQGISHNSEQYKSPEEFNYLIQWFFPAGSIKMEHLKTTYCAEYYFTLHPLLSLQLVSLVLLLALIYHLQCQQ